VLLGCVWWRRGRIRGPEVARSLPFFALSLVLGLATIWFHHNRALVMGGLAAQTGGILSRAAAAGSALWFYLYKAILPWNLCAIYPKWSINASLWISYLPGAALLGCFAMFWWKRATWGRPLLFGLGYFAVMLFPVLGFVYISFHEYSLVADHWQYQAIVGVIALIVAAGVTACHRMGERGPSIGILASVGVVMALGVATWRRSTIYGDSESLWRDTVVKNPNMWVAHYNLGNAYMQGGRIQEATREYEQAVRLKPDSVEPQSNLALTLLQAGRVDEAIPHLERVVRINPGFAEGHYDLANAYLQARRAQDAIGDYEQAVRLNPDYVEAHVNLGFALAQRGKFDEAVQHWETALRLDPGNQNAQRGLDRVRSLKSSNVPTP
jgi:protein O-mannosyl-transferase